MSFRAWLLGFAVVAVGCASNSGVSRTDNLMSSLDSLTKSSATARADIDTLAGTLKSIMGGGGGDPRGAFTKYQGDVGKVASSKAAVESAGGSVRQAMDAHFAAWEKEANEMQNPDIRAASMKRRDDARKALSGLEPSLTKAKATFDSFVGNLRDIEKLLGSDLSANGVKAAEDTIEKAADEGGEVKESLEKLEALVAEMQKALSVPPTPPPPAEKPAGETAPAK